MEAASRSPSGLPFFFTRKWNRSGVQLSTGTSLAAHLYWLHNFL